MLSCCQSLTCPFSGPVENHVCTTCKILSSIFLGIKGEEENAFWYLGYILEAEYRHRAEGVVGGEGRMEGREIPIWKLCHYLCGKIYDKKTTKDRTGTSHRYVPEKLGTNTEGFCHIKT